MTYFDCRSFKKPEYREFMERCLKENSYIIISTFEGNTLDSFGESVLLPEKIDYHNILISEIERLYCYKIKYHEAISTLFQYESFTEFFDMTDVYRLMFVKSNTVTVECMYDEIIVYEEPLAG